MKIYLLFRPYIVPVKHLLVCAAANRSRIRPKFISRSGAIPADFNFPFMKRTAAVCPARGDRLKIIPFDSARSSSCRIGLQMY